MTIDAELLRGPSSDEEEALPGPVVCRDDDDPDPVRRLDVAMAISPEAADVLAARLLGELHTRLGGLQIAHARRVAAAVRETNDDRVIAAALLHDVLEHAGVSANELRVMTGDAGVVALVDVLSRRDGETDEDYLSRCAADPMALVVKRVDLADKLVADDSGVAPVVAERIRREARERLALLDGLAPP